MKFADWRNAVNHELIEKMLYEIEDEEELFRALEQISDEETLLEYAQNYNWDDGFEIPEQILKHACCSLAVALQLFYDGEGIVFLYQEDDWADMPEEWQDFIIPLYQQIVNHDFAAGDCNFEIPLSKVETYRLKKLGCNEIFITDISV